LSYRNLVEKKYAIILPRRGFIKCAKRTIMFWRTINLLGV
jgi:hypothetical protein